MRTYYNALIWYKLLLRLYPRTYREKYETDMMNMFSDILTGSPTPSMQRRAAVLTIRETVPWIIKENGKILIQSIVKIPRFLKISSITSSVLIIPFFFIVGHNLYELHIANKGISPLFQTIGHSWLIYTLILPSAALLITLTTSIWYVHKPILSHIQNHVTISYQYFNTPILLMGSLSLIELLILI